MRILYKDKYETCLECLHKAGLEGYTYAGRLDPLAFGVLIALSGEESSDKESFLSLPKTYEFEVVLGVSTDTFDLLGLPTEDDAYLTWPTLIFDKETHDQLFREMGAINHEDIIKNIIKVFKNRTIDQFYPFYSSKPIDGVPLFEFVKTHGIKESISYLPKKEVYVHGLEYQGCSEILGSDLINEAIEACNRVSGDFRQKQIKDAWNTSSYASKKFNILKFKIEAGSGFYVRAFACWLGQILKVGAIARNIHRLKIGNFS